MDSYKTLRSAAEATLIEKKSRFIAGARPISSEEEVQAFLSETRKRYWDASHHVFAYVLGDRRRASDDGEPQGSAGLPVLETLTSAKIRDAMVVVTRYFGGTLLGVGGLVRAYSQAAKAGIDLAEVIEKRQCRSYHAELDYSTWERVRHAVGEYVSDIGYGEKITVEFLVETATAPQFEALFADATRGGTKLIVLGECYV